MSQVRYHNLKQEKEDRPRRKTPKEKRPGKDPEYLKKVRKLPCVVCGEPAPSECHHLKQGTNERGMGLRSSDKWAVPLCHEHHINGVERAGSRNELAWFESYGIAPLTLAKALWDSRHDLTAMERVLKAHRG